VTGSVFIIGISSKIGIELARRVAMAGRAVCGTYRTRSALLEGLCRDYPDLISLVQADFDEDDDKERLLGFLQQHVNTIDVVVHAPCTPLEIGPLRKLAAEDLSRRLSMQARSLCHVFPLLHKRIMRGDSFHIISVGSAALAGAAPKGFGSYVIEKSVAQIYFSMLATEYEKYGLRVSYVNPGMFDSPLLDNIPVAFKEGLLAKANSDFSLGSDAFTATLLEMERLIGLSPDCVADVNAPRIS
jgi:short-subunit dehydrogenase